MTQESVQAARSFVMDASFWTATAIFVLGYALIVSEKVHKTIVAVAGAALVLVLGILDQHEAFHVEELGVDWNVIFLLISMMIIINLMRPTGVFEYIAIRSAKWGKGQLAGAQQMFLPHKLFHIPGTHAVGKRGHGVM